MKFHVLMVEDNEADVFLMELALDGVVPDLQLHVVTTGPDALDFLNRQTPYEDAPTPHLVLLDGSTPCMTAAEVLTHVREGWSDADLPVVVFSGSSSEADIQRALQAGANGYVTKPLGLEEYTQAVQDTLHTWYAYALTTHA
ncbi:response regulator [Deinococcus malanensis]|uniref:Response regulator n=1 Tax=Deinococcus malanensis TaxID=1706855 RepID=A0ABQ2F1W1_9DEIO|nr:response regulator [Deinococcus malanensis]GGK42282.1 response regulator [Deinococcus malanensis]